MAVTKVFCLFFKKAVDRFIQLLRENLGSKNEFLDFCGWCFNAWLKQTKCVFYFRSRITYNVSWPFEESKPSMVKMRSEHSLYQLKISLNPDVRLPPWLDIFSISYWTASFDRRMCKLTNISSWILLNRPMTLKALIPHPCKYIPIKKPSGLCQSNLCCLIEKSGIFRTLLDWTMNQLTYEF